MKAPLFIVVVVLALVFLATGAAGPQQGHDSSVAQLEKRIVSLEQRIESLEKELASIKAKPRPAVRPPVRPPRGSNPPRGWRRKEFNDRSCYVIPLKQRSSRSTQPQR